MTKAILNIAAGKFQPINLEPISFLVNLDTMYYHHTETSQIEEAYESWKIKRALNARFHCNEDAFSFMERTIINFDKVCIYRFLEHVSYTQVLYFIYLLSTITRKGSLIDVIVPNYEKLATMILKELVSDLSFEAHNILLTTELLNEPSCPHASIWTPARAEYFFELENRFKVNQWVSDYEFDGRKIYLRFLAERI